MTHWGKMRLRSPCRRALCPKGNGFPQSVFAKRKKSAKSFLREIRSQSKESRKIPRTAAICAKKNIFENIVRIANENGIQNVVDGTNADDSGDYRPGLAALRELKIGSPLLELGFSKEDIRRMSKIVGLKTWDNPSFACLASRFAYGEPLTEKELLRVEKAEDFFLAVGFRQIRVRVHGNLSRVEVLPSEMEKALLMRFEITDKLKALGFDYVTLDLNGFQSGSMNLNVRG